MKKHIDRLFKKIGYVPQEKYKNTLSLSHRQERRIKELERLTDLDINRIIQVIKEAKITMVEYKTPYSLADNPESMTTDVNFRYPASSDWYAVTTQIDVGFLSRVNNDLLKFGRSAELDYFLEATMRKLINDAKIAMRLSERN